MNGREGPPFVRLRGGVNRRLISLHRGLINGLGRCHGLNSVGRGVIRDNTIASR